MITLVIGIEDKGNKQVGIDVNILPRLAVHVSDKQAVQLRPGDDPTEQESIIAHHMAQFVQKYVAGRRKENESIVFPDAAELVEIHKQLQMDSPTGKLVRDITDKVTTGG